MKKVKIKKDNRQKLLPEQDKAMMTSLYIVSNASPHQSNHFSNKSLSREASTNHKKSLVDICNNTMQLSMGMITQNNSKIETNRSTTGLNHMQSTNYPLD